jgi:putative tricarboxylic transport membrane protein
MPVARRGERVFGAALSGVGIAALIAARDLPFGTLNEPAAGFFPLAVAAILIVFGVLSLFDRSPGQEHAQLERVGVIRVGILAALVAAYALLLPSIGFLPCTFVLLGAVLRGLGGVAWLASIAGAGAAAIGCYFLFTRLGMPLPAGLLGF